MSLRWQKAWNDLCYNKSRTVLVILSIAVGVVAFGSIAGARETINRDLSAGYQAARPDSVTLYTSPFTDSLTRSVTRLPGVEAAAGVRQVRVRARFNGGAWQSLDLIAVEDYTRLQVNLVQGQTGAWPPPDRQLLLERNALELLDVSMGETLELELPDGRLREVPMTGLVYDGSRVPATIAGVVYGYVSLDTLQWLGLPTTFDQLELGVASAADLDATVAQVERKIERGGGTVYRSVVATDEFPAQEFLDTILWLLGAVGLLALLLSAFLTVNTIQAILTQQVRQIGVMKAIGARTSQISGLYLRMVLLFGGVALLVALPLSVAGTQWLARYLAGRLNFDISTWQQSPQVWGSQVAAGLLVPILAALYPVLAAVRVTVREALSDTGLSEPASRAGLLDRLLLSLNLSRPLRLSLRNTFRRRGRLILTLLTLTLGGALFVSVLSVRTSLLASLDESLRSQGYDVQAQLGQLYREEKLVRLLEGQPGVARLECWRLENTAPVAANGLEGDPITLYAVPPETQLFEPTLVAGRWLTPADQNALVLHHTVLDRDPSLHLGGDITLNVGDRDVTWQIVGVVSDLQPRVSAAKAYVNADYFARVMGDAHQANLVQIITTDHSSLTNAQVMQQVEQTLTRAGVPVQKVQSAGDMRALMTDRFNVIMTMLGIMSLLVVAVGALGLMGTMSINVLERRREIGVMRAIGASDWAVMQIFLTEGVVISLLSWLGAMILTQPLSRYLSYETGRLFLQMPLIFEFAGQAAAWWLLAVIIIGLVASFMPARSAAALPVREIIAYE
ncbi:MAG TPA: ABC transporter permease [Anaerolineae bacterium]|nr:ABC transporter permease [Anaerolineae bacterium]